MKLKLKSSVYVFIVMLIVMMSCHQHYYTSNYELHTTAINQVQAEDSAILKIIAPYKDSVDRQMNTVIGYCRLALKKEQPEGALGNFVCDALMQHFVQYKPDMVIMNNGGLRIPQLPEGAIYRRTIFELLPFDNKVVVVTIDGKKLNQLCKIILEKKGWPIAGIQIIHSNYVLKKVYIAGDTIQPQKQYTLLTNDYLANGGDACTMLTTCKTTNTGVMLRDALIAYITKLQSHQQKIASSVDGRIVEQKE